MNLVTTLASVSLYGKKTATALARPFNGHGHRPELDFEGAQIFVMPGPYERSDRVQDYP